MLYPPCDSERCKAVKEMSQGEYYPCFGVIKGVYSVKARYPTSIEVTGVLSNEQK